MTAEMKPVRSVVAAVAALAGSGAALGQVDLYSNQGPSASVPALGASATSLSGVPAPAGFMWSEVASIGSGESNAVAGFSTHSTGLTGAYRFADDFTVTDPAGWSINRIAFFAYQTNASGLVSPFSAMNVQIWSGRPGDVGSVVVYGDTATNRLVSSVSTNIYRVFNTLVAPLPLAPDASRLIWRSEAAMGNVHLAAGTYWIDWQYVMMDPTTEAFSPPATTPGARTQSGANARQFRINGAMTASVWANTIDLGKPSMVTDVTQDLPFVVNGAVGTACVADFNADGGVNSQDFFDFLAAFFAVSPTADVNHDGSVNSQDFFDFLSAFFVGC